MRLVFIRVAAALAATLFFRSSIAEPQLPPGYKLLYQQSFDSPASTNDFVMTDAKAWHWAREDHGGSLELVNQSKYNPPFRSPFNLALIKDKTFGDFVLEANLKQTGKEYGHRDMCLFFGFQDPTHFYYAHLATKADEHAHNIFIVQEAPRIKIAQSATDGVNWGLEIWHKVRLERKVSDGVIKVYFDDMTRPVMTAEDKRLDAGFIGFGSFDDTGKVENVKIWGPEEGPAKPPVHFQSTK